jgi:hypothetical protein
MSSSMLEWVIGKQHCCAEGHMCTGLRLVNKSGLRLSYWAAGPGGGGGVHTLNAWEESPLLVEPVERAVVLADTQQQVGLGLPAACAQFCSSQIWCI